MSSTRCIAIVVVFTLSLLLTPVSLADELRFDNDQTRGTFQGLKAGQAEAMRLTALHPASVLTIRMNFSKGGSVEIHVWGDDGGQQPSWEHDLVTPIRAEVPTDGWLEVELSNPPEICPECHFHIGHVLLADDGPTLLIDSSEAPYPRALLWGYSTELGTNTWFAVGEEVSGVLVYRHYIARCEVYYHDVIIDKRFVDVSEETGFGRPSRIAAVDFDEDGDIDVLQDGRLLRNENGIFVDVSQELGLAGYPSVAGGVFVDFDHDYDLDLFLFANSCCNPEEAQGVHDRLLRNDGGMFVDVTDTAGAFDYRPNESAAWGDFDGDGYPDLFLPGYELPGSTGVPTGNTLFRNNQDSTFSDVSRASMISWVPSQVSRTVTWADYDQDGWLDLYVGAYRLQRNYLFKNRGGSFQEVGTMTGTAGIETNGYFGHTIGAEWGDLDNDGDLDLVVMNLAHPRFLNFSDLSKIYLNPHESGSDLFIDVREEVGVAYRETASEPALGDFDNDGDLDLFQTNVYVGRESNLYSNQLVEEGRLRFEEVSYPAGARVDNGWGATWADYDGDGDLDLLTRGLFQNNGPVNNWLKVRLVGDDGQDTFGVGATITVEANGLSMTRLVSAGKGVGNQAPFEQHFGLADFDRYDRITVHWPSDQLDAHPCGLANQRLVLRQGEILAKPEGVCGTNRDETAGCGCSARNRTLDSTTTCLIMIVWAVWFSVRRRRSGN